MDTHGEASDMKSGLLNASNPSETTEPPTNLHAPSSPFSDRLSYRVSGPMSTSGPSEHGNWSSNSRPTFTHHQSIPTNPRPLHLHSNNHQHAASTVSSSSSNNNRDWSHVCDNIAAATVMRRASGFPEIAASLQRFLHLEGDQDTLQYLLRYHQAEVDGHPDNSEGWRRAESLFLVAEAAGWTGAGSWDRGTLRMIFEKMLEADLEEASWAGV